MKNRLFLLFPLLTLGLLGCLRPKVEVNPAPIITEFSPKVGGPGTVVALKGMGFSPILENNTVTFGVGAKAVVQSASGTELTVMVPVGAVTGTTTVKVGEQAGTSADPFTIINLTLTDFNPKTGRVGQTVTVIGKDFSLDKTQMVVAFTGKAAVTSSVSETSVVVTVPDGASTGPISLNRQGVVVNSVQSFTLIPPPTIASFSPASGGVGATVTIMGDGFSTVASENVIKFNGIVAMVTSASQTKLVVTVPAGASSGKITNDVAGLKASSATDFLVIDVGISDFSPKTGRTGTSVTLIGKGFSTDKTQMTAKVNGKVASISTATETSLVIVIPDGASTGPISVERQGIVTQSSQPFVVIPPPSIASFDPTSGLPGTTVTITGDGFSTVTSENVVKFNGTAATVSSASQTKLVVTVPAGATTGKISNDVAGLKATSTADFLVKLPTPTITSFDPTSGTDATRVTITGTNLGTAPIVKVNGKQAALVSSNGSTQLIITIPAGAGTGRITVDNNAQTATSTRDFVYTAPDPSRTLLFYAGTTAAFKTLQNYALVSGPQSSDITAGMTAIVRVGTQYAGLYSSTNGSLILSFNSQFQVSNISTTVFPGTATFQAISSVGNTYLVTAGQSTGGATQLPPALTLSQRSGSTFTKVDAITRKVVTISGLAADDQNNVISFGKDATGAAASVLYHVQNNKLVEIASFSNLLGESRTLNWQQVVSVGSQFVFFNWGGRTGNDFLVGKIVNNRLVVSKAVHQAEISNWTMSDAGNGVLMLYESGTGAIRYVQIDDGVFTTIKDVSYEKGWSLISY